MKNRLNKELGIFQNLNKNSQLLLVSYVLYGAGFILTSIFINAFLFQNTDDSINTLIFYNSLSFIGIYIAFVINGILLRNIRINYLNIFGLLLQGVGPVLIIVLSNFIDSQYLQYLGFINGMGIGFYWSNRNYIEFNTVTNSQRDYFYGINQVFSTLTGIVFPILAGYFIAGSENFGLSTNTTYFIVMSIGFLLFLSAGLVIINKKFKKPKITRLLLLKSSTRWNWIRVSAFFNSAGFAIYLIIPTVLILRYVGDESSLGAIETVGAIITAVAIYIVGRKIKTHQRNLAILICVGIYGLSVLGLNIFWGTYGVLIFIFLNRIINPIRGNAVLASWFEGIETENSKSETDENYLYIVDQEFFINLGRVVMLLVLLLLLSIFTEDVALRIILIMVIITNYITYIAFKIHKKL